MKRLKTRNFTVLDVERVLRSGVHDREKDTVGTNGNWRYRIFGKTIDGREIKVAVEVNIQVIVVTVID